MKLILCRHPAIGSYLLRAWMGSRWSHAAIWDDECSMVYDTTLQQGGVRASFEYDWFSRFPTRRIINLPSADAAQAREWLKAQVGKPYDLTALVRIFFRTRAWNDPGRWFCSELAASCINLFVKPLFSADAAAITPYHLDLLTDVAYDIR
jgi:uncharacterized protein YycO